MACKKDGNFKVAINGLQINMTPQKNSNVSRGGSKHPVTTVCTSVVLETKINITLARIHIELETPYS